MKCGSLAEADQQLSDPPASKSYTMVFSNLKTLFALSLSLSILCTGVSASLPEEQHVFNDTVVHVEDPDTLRVPPPHFVIYADRWIPGQLATPPVSQVKVRLCSS